MNKSLNIFEDWIASQYEYNADGSVDKDATKNNFIRYSTEGLGTVEVVAISNETNITRSVFYQNNGVASRLELLRNNLHETFPSHFAQFNKDKKIKKENRPSENDSSQVAVDRYDQDAVTNLTLKQHNTRLEKELQEEKAKNVMLEKDIAELERTMKKYVPSIKALLELNAFPMPVRGELNE